MITYISKFFMTFLLFRFAQCETDRYETKVFKCENSMVSSRVTADYIEFKYEEDSIIQGFYYGHTMSSNDLLYFRAKIRFDMVKNDSIVFYLDDYRFSKKAVTPFSTSNLVKLDRLPIDLSGDVKFFGNYRKEGLSLSKVMWYADSKSEKMEFLLVETDE